MRNRSWLWAAVLALLAGLSLPAAQAQHLPRDAAEAHLLAPVPGLLSNSVSVLHAQGDSLWIGPFLNLTPDGGQTFLAPDAEDLQPGGSNRLFSLDIEGEVLWAGLGFASEIGGVASAGGFLVSRDGGQTFAFRRPPLDDLDDTTVVYGVSQLRALPISRPEQSAPFAIDYHATGDTVWTANWFGGHRLSTDGGRTWERVVLPPDSLAEIRPDEPHGFRIAPATVAGGDSNYVAFSVLVDETGTVWAGTANGVNRSRPQDVVRSTLFDGPERIWRHFKAEQGARLTGSQVVAIEEQPLEGRRNPVWMATWGIAQGERFGVSFTRDGGQTFEQTLLDRRVNDFAFRGETVYAAASEGLFVLDADGTVRRAVTDFYGEERPARREAPRLSVLAVATTPGALWVGTADGLFKSTDDGETFTRFGAEIPLDPQNPTEEVPRVETYAYPNPFSPNASPSGRVRIVVEVHQAREVEVEVFDYAMNRVRRLRRGCPSEGRCEIAWDGTDEGGRRVANGVYFYTAETGRETVRGKIVVLE